MLLSSLDKNRNISLTETECRGVLCGFKKAATDFRSLASDKVQTVLPSPHSELVMGMVLGENRFKNVLKYNDVLKKVGLVHVVVVSGYNISLVFILLMRVLGSQYKIKNLIAGLFITLLYAGISGFGIPSIRAWIMGSVAALSKYYGLPSRGIKMLSLSALVIILADPAQLFSVSFQLSFGATLGVMTLPDSITSGLTKLGITAKNPLAGDFITSLSAQLMVTPVIAYYFGTVSLISLIANPLVLWVVPVCTILGGLLVAGVLVSPLLGTFFALIVFPFLDYFVRFSEVFSGFSSGSVSLNFNLLSVVVYYSVLFLLLALLKRKVSLNC